MDLRNVTENTCKLAVCPKGPRDEDLASPAPKNCAPEFRRWKYLQIRPRPPLGPRSHLLDEPPPLHSPPPLRDEDVADLLLGFSTSYILDETTDGEAP